jgi:hypothetical protein
MMKTKMITTMRVKVQVTPEDIKNSECRLPSRCMEKVAITRALKHQFKLSDRALGKLHLRVDAGHIKYNLNGRRCMAPTPKITKTALIDFDRKRTVKPHVFTFEAVQGDKVVPMTVERMQQINEARKARIKAGKPDKIYESDRIRQRIVGHDLGRTKRARRDHEK